jgi:hypothetical protein
MRGALVVAALLGATATAHAFPVQIPVESIVFARDQSLWRVDVDGASKAVEIAHLGLPASGVTSIRSSRDGKVLLLEVAGAWHWVDLSPEAAPSDDLPTIQPLTCAPGPATLAADGNSVVCATDDGKPVIHRIRPKVRTAKRHLAGRDITFLDGYSLELAIVTDAGIVAQSVRRPREQRMLAPETPVRAFLPSPDGKRALGVYREVVAGKGKDAGKQRDALVTFALDGRGTRRPHIRNGTPILWSWDSQWVLVQEARAGGVTAGCLARGVGGEYKCWKGYTAVGISPDGSYVLLLGSATQQDEEGEDGGDKDAEDDEKTPEKDKEAVVDTTPPSANPFAAPIPKGPLSLYRGKLTGAYTEAPQRIERKVDGAAVWIPLPPPPPVAPKISPPPAPSEDTPK